MRVQQDDPTDPDDWLDAPGGVTLDTMTWQTLAHLDVLAVAGRLRRSDTDGISRYAKD